MKAQALVQKVLKVIRLHRLIEPGETVLIGVSGGSDSMALLHILYRLRDCLRLNLVVAHLDHQLYPEESRKALDFVRHVVKKLGLVFIEDTINARAYAKKHSLSLEDGARRLRYAFFEKVSKKVHASKIAVAHTRNDQAETVLMKLIRGTGMEGLRGMRYARSMQKMSLIRPLLGISREELRKFLRSQHFEWKDDSSNAKPVVMRNRVRKRILPLLVNEFNPQMDEALSRVAEHLSIDHDFLENETDRAFAKTVVEKSGELIIHLALFKKLHPSIQKRVLLRALRMFYPKGNLASGQIVRLLQLIAFSQSGRRIVLPKKMEACLQQGQLRMGPLEKKLFKKFKIFIPDERTFRMGLQTFTVSTRMVSRTAFQKRRKRNPPFSSIWKSEENKPDTTFYEYFDASRIEQPILVRSRKSGDQLDPLGLHGRKTVKDICIDEKVPLKLRNHIPIFVSGDKIFWVGGYRISESFKVRPETKEVVEVRLKIEAGKTDAGC